MASATTTKTVAAAALLLVAGPALADVKAGVDAWSRGDYAAAVGEWRQPAAAGDADAQFNLAQAYRLGRGVEQNAKQAEILYAKAAAQGHLQAADNYGLLLFQDGRREEAMPYVTAAAERGDPRAQYLIGIAHFNGDLVEKDWVRAYALLTLANSAGLPQAVPAIKQMDQYIPLEQRQEAQGLAAEIKRSADARRSAQLAKADLEMGAGATGAAPSAPVAAEAAAAAARPVARTRIPQPIPTTAVPPSVAAARVAVEEAERVTGTGNPANAGAPGAARSVATQATPPRPSPAPAQQPVAAQGSWRVQLGAFSVAGNAEKLWSQLSGRAELKGRERILVSAGRLTKLQAGGFASRQAAQSACNGLKAAGQACLVTR